MLVSFLVSLAKSGVQVFVLTRFPSSRFKNFLLLFVFVFLISNWLSYFSSVILLFSWQSFGVYPINTCCNLHFDMEQSSCYKQKHSPLVCKIKWKWKANQCDERVFIFEIAIKYFPIWIIAGKRRERGYISDNHLNQTG